MGKYRFVPWYETNDEGKIEYVALIQVKGRFLWHNVTEVRDTDEEYVMNRADEIVGILENPNR